MSRLTELISDARSVAIIGHIRPDGDDVGSCLGMYNYILANYSQVKKLRVFLETPPGKFFFLSGVNEIKHKPDENDKDYELVLCLDCATRDRLGDFASLLDTAKHSMCIDHHKTNPGYCEFNEIRGDASSTCEVIFELIDDKKINTKAAACLYTGIVHDTGVFQYSATTQRTMEIAGSLLTKGVSAEEIITQSFYQKSFNQLRAWGYAFENAVLCENGKAIYAIFTWKDMKKFKITSVELDGISSELRNVEGVLYSMLIYQDGEDEFKVSMRSSGNVDCSVVAQLHGGGGHAHASGCNVSGDPEAAAQLILSEIREQLR